MVKWIVIALCLVTTSIFPKIMTGTVVYVIDGDTLIVAKNNKKYKVRLAHIDAPEIGKAYADQATNELEKLCLNKYVIMYAIEKDKYERWVSIVRVDNIDVNKHLVKKGLAKWYEAFSQDKSYKWIQEQAKKQKIGIWSEK